MAVSWFTISMLAVSAFGVSITPENQLLEKSECGRVWVTVHAPDIKFLSGDTLIDALELNWNFSGCPVKPKQIGIFEERPTSWNNALVIYTLSSEEGYIVSNVSLGETQLAAGWEKGTGLKGPHCLWPWVGAGNDIIQAYNCLKIQPTWMEDNAENINKLHIGELVLAGTHNAGAWRFNTEMSTVTRDNFVLCQDRSVWAQLVHGIRYLDFRIAYYDFYQNEEDRYWLNHNLIRVRPLIPLLKEIRTFMDSTMEIVFLDAHHFPIGFKKQDGSPIPKVHAGLLELVQRELGPHLAPAGEYLSASSRGPTLQNLLDSGKRLVFSYVENSVVAENDWLWPRLPHLWANTNSPRELLSYLDEAINESPNPTARSPLFSAMAETTPTVLDILLLRGSIRQSADAVNRNVTKRLATRWKRAANIISTDFFLSNDVIQVSIDLSVERAKR